MNKTRVCVGLLTFLAVVLLLAEPAWAPIFGRYPGLDKLVERADAIAVVQIVECVSDKEAAPTSHVDYLVRVRDVLKGDMPGGQRLKVSLRCLPLRVNSDARVRPFNGWGFKSDYWYIVFFRQAMAEIEEGLEKEYVRLYTRGRVMARARVLREIDMPWPEHGSFLIVGSPPGGYLREYVFPHLERIAKEQEAEGEYTKAANTSELSIEIGKQYGEDTFLWCERESSENIKRTGYRDLKALYERLEMETELARVTTELERVETERERLYSLVEKYLRFHHWYRRGDFKRFVADVLANGEVAALEKL